MLVANELTAATSISCAQFCFSITPKKRSIAMLDRLKRRK
jgi:hypothetical protein